MSAGLIMALLVYGIVGFGAALGTVPRKFFTHPVERFLVRTSSAITWPMLFGYLLAQTQYERQKREES